MNCYPLPVTVSTTSTASTASSTIAAENQPGARLLSVHLLAGQTLATTAVLTVTAALTGQVMLTATLTATAGWHRAPRQPLYTQADLLVNVATTAGNHEPFYVGGQGITLAVTAAGVSKTGSFIIVTG